MSGSLLINGKTISATMGAGIYIIDANPVLRHVNIRDNVSTSRGGGMLADHSNPILLDVNFSNNTGQYAVAMYCSDTSGKPLMIGGSVTGSQGGPSIGDSGTPIFVNVTISGNRGAGIIPVVTYAGPLLLINVTVSGNVGGISGLTNGNYINVYNSVIKNNGASNISNSSSYISTASNMINGSNPYDPAMDDPFVNEGNNNRYPVNPDGTQNAASPMFTSSYPTSPTPPYANYSYYFESWAPSLRTEVLEFLMKDNAGNPRFKGSVIDIGALEAQ
jgi:hypothetical protein